MWNLIWKNACNLCVCVLPDFLWNKTPDYAIQLDTVSRKKHMCNFNKYIHCVGDLEGFFLLIRCNLKEKLKCDIRIKYLISWNVLL